MAVVYNVLNIFGILFYHTTVHEAEYSMVTIATRLVALKKYE